MEQEQWDGDQVQPNIPKKRSTFYVNPNVDLDFRKICEREGTSVSKKLEEFMEEYSLRHKPGNPQLSILPYVKPEAPGPNHVLCSWLHGRRNDGHVFCSNIQLVKNPTVEGKISGEWLNGVTCYGCKFNRLRKK